jgi:hypothetical protein
MINPGAGILFMKVGTHAQEGLDEIIARKLKEIDDAGYGLWGYGGNTCHPRTMVQPFAEEFEKREEPIYLFMNQMTSNHFGEPVRAQEYSPDGLNWHPVPPQINVLGSRFALRIKSLIKKEFDLPLDQTRVAVGNQQGKLGSRYIQGHVDKACLEVMPEAEKTNEAPKVVKINLIAELEAPYAVFLRN